GLHVAGGDRPESGARLDRPAAEEEPSLPAADRAHDHLGIDVVDLAAARADVSQAVVARRQHPLDLAAAAAAEAQPARPASARGPLEEGLGGAAQIAGLGLLCFDPADLLAQGGEIGIELLYREAGERA